MDMTLVMQRVEQLLSVGLPEQQFKQYLQNVLILLIDLLRHVEGDEFAAGFLQGAINSIDEGTPPVMKMIKKVQH